MSFDVTDDEDPQIAWKIAELHRRRYEEDPALAKLVSDLASYTGSSDPAHTPTDHNSRASRPGRP